jgi:VanZ family protein
VAETTGPPPGRPVGRRFFSAWLPVLLLEAVVLFLSSRQGLALPATIPHLDKVAHFGEYALLGWLLRRALVITHPGWRGATALTIIVVAILGAGDELFQGTVPGRDSSPFDWMADLCGGTAGAVAARMWYRRRAGTVPAGRQRKGTNG